MAAPFKETEIQDNYPYWIDKTFLGVIRSFDII